MRFHTITTERCDDWTAILITMYTATAAIAKESGADHFVPDVQIPSYNEATLKKDICTAGSGASFCN